MERTPGAQPDLRSALEALWRRRWLFFGIFLTIPIAVYLVSTLLPKTYEAYALIRTQTTTLQIPGLATSSLNPIGSEALLVDTSRITKAAAEEFEMPGALGSMRADPVTTSSGADTDLIQLTAQADSGPRAAATANAYAAAVDRVRTEDSLKEIDRTMNKLRAQATDTKDEVARSEINRQLALLRSSRSATADSTETVQAATTPTEPISPNPQRNTMLAAVVSLLLALAAVVVRERLDRRLRDPNELEPLLGSPLLSVIPRAAYPGARPSPNAVREAFRTLASSLVYFNIDQPLSTVLITSPTKGDGKTTVAVHLAAALAGSGQDVVLVDADLRHPQAAVRLGIEPSIGLTEVLTNQGDLRDALVDVDVGDGRLRVLAAGGRAPNPSRLLSSKNMRSLLARLSEKADIVVMDTPPLLNVSDAVPLLKSVSGTVLVAKVGATSRDALIRSRQVIDTAHGTLLGMIASGSRGAGLYGYYGGDHYHDYDTGDAEDGAAAVDGPGAYAAGEPDGIESANGRGETVSPGSRAGQEAHERDS